MLITLYPYILHYVSFDIQNIVMHEQATEPQFQQFL